MKSPDPDTAVRRFLDGDVADDEVRAALHQIADDPEARSLLQFELRVTQELAASRSEQPTPAFARRTMKQVERADSTASALARLRSWWRNWTLEPVRVRIRPISAAVAAVVLLGTALLLWPAAPTAPSETSVASGAANGTMQTAAASSERAVETVWTRFVYVDNDAKSVAVAGDFSQWEPVSLSPRTVNGKTVWTGLVRVQRGEHEYQYVIDGEKWVTDPLAPIKRDDGFGAENAVLKL